MKPLVLFAAAASLALAQSDRGPICEPIPEVEQRIREIRNDSTRPMPGRLEWQAAEYRNLIEQYPREPVLYRRYYLLYRDEIPDQVEAIRQQYVDRAARNQNDPLAVYLSGLVFEGVDSPRAIETVKKAVQLDPNFSWNYLTLAYFYAYGKSPDKAKAGEYMAQYHKVCPQNADSFSLSMLNRFGSPDLWTSAAKAIRGRLDKETDPRTLERYSDLWALEFKTMPVPEHPKERERIAADLKRIAALNPRPKAEWLQFVIGAMKQSGAGKTAIAAVEDRILREFPRSEDAYSLTVQRWRAGHPTPKSTESADLWDEYAKAHLTASEDWLKQFPDQESDLIDAMLDDVTGLPSPDKARLRELGDRFLRATERRWGVQYTPRYTIPYLLYLRFGVDPARSVELLESARPLLLKNRARDLQRDSISDKSRAELTEYLDQEEVRWARAMAIAYRRAGMGSKAAALRAIVEPTQPSKPDAKADRFAALAEISAAEGRYADALAWYKSALEARLKPPAPTRGRIVDRLLDGAHEVWTLAGGSESLWPAFSKPPERSGKEASDSRWEEPKKPLPTFELTDIRGKKWTLKSLEGKTLLINLWATWCGPCQNELPHFQTLYEKTKDRADVAVFSFNIDDEIGLVEPFLKEKGYTFPVLLASPYVHTVLDSVGIPQNWIIDKTGVWSWQQIGYDGDPKWEAMILDKIAASK